MPNALYDPSRIDPIIEQLRAQWYANPHMRLGQLLVNVIDCTDVFHVSDDAIRDRLKSYGK